MTVKLKSCPFCGSDEIRESPNLEITCFGCYASAPNRMRWNTRKGEPSCSCLSGQDAKDFIKEFNTPLTDKQRAYLKKCKKVYQDSRKGEEAGK